MAVNDILPQLTEEGGGKNRTFVEMFSHYLERGGWVELDGHTGIHYDILHEHQLGNGEEKIVVTRLDLTDGRKRNVIHVRATERIKRIMPVLDYLGFRLFALCPIFKPDGCLTLVIEPEVKWQTSTLPRHMVLFTSELIELVEQPWTDALYSWEKLQTALKKYDDKKLPDLKWLFKVKID